MKKKCFGITKKGEKCKNICKTKYCYLHKGSAFRLGKKRRTTPRLYYAPLVSSVKENKAMRGW